MLRILRSKVGIALACVYLLAMFVALLEAYGSKSERMDSLGLLILTAPWSFFLGILLSKLNIINIENGDTFLPFLVTFGGIINILILLLIGGLLTKLFIYLSTSSKPS